jgi:antitoxin ParD1/3/4
MATVEISLPDSLKEFAEEQANKAGYSNVGQYVRSLLEDEQRRRAKSELEAKLLKSLNSGPSIKADDAFWENIDARIRKDTSRRASS